MGDWVIFDSGEEDDPIWLGRVMSHPDWGGQGVQQNVTRRIQSYPSGAKIGRNEVAMNIMWYEKMDISLDALDYQVSRSFTSPIVQNNKYFIPITVNMHRVLGGSNPVPKLRTSARSNMSISANTEARNNAWHDKEFGLRWKMDNIVRESALSRCNMWRQ